MSESNSLHEWAILLGSLATIALILTAFGVMLGIVRPADAAKHIGAALGIVIVLMLIPGVLANLWSGISLGQRIALAVIGIGILCWRRTSHQKRKGKAD